MGSSFVKPTPLAKPTKVEASNKGVEVCVDGMPQYFNIISSSWSHKVYQYFFSFLTSNPDRSETRRIMC